MKIDKRPIGLRLSFLLPMFLLISCAGSPLAAKTVAASTPRSQEQKNKSLLDPVPAHEIASVTNTKKYQFKCDLIETSNRGIYKYTFTYITEANSNISERKKEIFKKLNGKYTNLIDISDEYMKKEHTKSQSWKTVHTTWTVNNLIFNPGKEFDVNIVESISRDDLKFTLQQYRIMSGIRLDSPSDFGKCNMSEVDFRKKAF